MSQKKPRKQAQRGRSHRLEVAYWFEVVDFVTSGSYSTWEPEEIPRIFRHEYPEDPKVPLVEETLNVEMTVWPIDPILKEVHEATFSIHGKRRAPELPRDPPRNGVLDKRKHVLRGFSFASFQFAQELAAALYSDRLVLLNVYGARLYYGKAALGPVSWYDARHSTPEAELSDIAELDGNERAAELLKRVREGEEAWRTRGLGVRSID